jgi:hypothetical protein
MAMIALTIPDFVMILLAIVYFGCYFGILTRQTYLKRRAHRAK